MDTILQNAQELVYSLLCLMPSVYQKASLKALLGLLLSQEGHALPAHSEVKSASALSRFEVNPFLWTAQSGSSESHRTPIIPPYSVVHAPISLQILMGSNSPTMSGFSSSYTPLLGTLPFAHTPL